MANKIINIPDLGEAEDVEVIEVCAKAGDQVEAGIGGIGILKNTMA